MMAFALALAGCSGETGVEGPGAVVDDGVVEDPAAPSGMPSGIVFRESDADLNETLVVRDIGTGAELGRAAIPRAVDVGRRDAFDETMTRLVYVKRCRVYLATLTGGIYTTSAEWAPEQAFGKGVQCYDRPVFRDGRIHAVLGVALADEHSLVSLDPAQPEQAPRVEGPGSPRQEVQYTVAGRADTDVRVRSKDDAITDVEIYGQLPPEEGEISSHFHYDCGVPVTGATFLCTLRGGSQTFGSVAVTTVDTGGETVSVKQLVPESRTGRMDVLLARDGNRVAIHDATGWYTTAIDTGAAPARQPLGQDVGLGDPLFWH